MSYLPKDIWVTTGAAPGACDAAAFLSGTSSTQNRQVSLLQGQAQLQMTTVGPPDGWLRVTLTAAGQGWLGFGVARPGMWWSLPILTWCMTYHAACGKKMNK